MNTQTQPARWYGQTVDEVTEFTSDGFPIIGWYIYTSENPRVSGAFLVTNRTATSERTAKNYLSVLLPIGDGFGSREEAQAYINSLPAFLLGGQKLFPFAATGGKAAR